MPERNSEMPMVGRKEESRQFVAALRNRESKLIWGPMDAGKTTLVKSVIDSLPVADARRCVLWESPKNVRDLEAELVRLLYRAGDSVVRRKVREDGADGSPSLNGWLREQTSGRLKILLYEAAQQGRYWFFLDHQPPATHSMVRLMKEIIWRCKTPVYWIARGCTPVEIGSMWSVYFIPQFHIKVGPLAESVSRDLLEDCIQRLGLASLDLSDFREEVLQFSGGMPGAIIKMCELAANPRYHYGDQVKTRLIHVDYLMQTSPTRSQIPVVRAS